MAVVLSTPACLTLRYKFTTPNQKASSKYKYIYTHIYIW